MFTTKFGENELKVVIEQDVQKDMFAKGINPVEVFRLVESFAAKLLGSGKDEVIRISNEDTGASLDLDVKWEAEKQAVVTVSIVNLDNLNLEKKPMQKLNLAADIPEEPVAN